MDSSSNDEKINEIRQLKEQLETLETVRKSCSQRVDLMNNLLAQYKMKLRNSLKEFQNCQAQLNEAKQRNQALQNELESLKSNSNS